jgi:long-chain acyl-CoA synthetase
MAQKVQTWRLLYNPDGDVADIVAYGASVAEGRIAGKYQLSTTLVPDTLIIQRSREKGIIAGADVTVDKNLAAANSIAIAKMARQGRNGARAIGTVQLSELTSKASRNFSSVDVDPDDPAVIIYTSGTTGNPKGAMLTHRNFHFQCTTIVKSLISFTHEDRVIGVLPLYHIYGLANALIVSFHYGACLVLMPQYSPQSLLETIDRNRATIMPAIPSMYQLLLGLARTKSRSINIPKSLRACISGGAPLSLAVMKDFMTVFDTKIMEGYGLTESTSSVCANGVGGIYKEGSIGKAADGVELNIFNEQGREVLDGSEGEIAIRSETLFKGYWNNPEATREVLNDEGWFFTGDLGYRDSEGFYFITDRKKDIIITHGYNISPREVEEVLAEHPKVIEAAVVNVPNVKGDETVTAFVVPKFSGPEGAADPARKPTHRELQEFCELHLAPYKRPRQYVIVDSLPKSATGKVLRRELRGDSDDTRLIERSDA